MRNVLSLILIVLAIAGVFFIFQKTYIPEETDNTNQIVKNQEDSQPKLEDQKIKVPDNLLFIEEALFNVEDSRINSNTIGSARLKHNGIDMYELNIAADLPQPEDQVYVAWLTGGIDPDNHIYLGKLKKQSYLGYGLIYEKSEIYEQFLAYHIVLISLEDKGEVPAKPSDIKLRADVR